MSHKPKQTVELELADQELLAINTHSESERRLQVSSPHELNTSGVNLEASKSIPPILLEWSDMTYTILKKGKKAEKRVTILNGVSGYANPGELLVLMGSSGAGKTTLLNLLCGRISSVGNVEHSGTILANGENVKNTNFTDHIGYVTQEDLMMSTMTCREILEFVASLKVEGTMEYRKKVVQDMIEHLQITKAADTVIGSQFVKGISGGERKRVAIGVELLSDPSVLFLDEPTSGLDGYTADMIVDLLLREARDGRTVITTIHQPSYNMYKNFQRLILLFEGNIVFQGPAKKSRHHFAEAGYATPKLINPPDYYMEILHIKSRSHKTDEEIHRLKQITTAYEENKSQYLSPKSNLYTGYNDLPPINSLRLRYKSPWLDQFKFNIKRNFKHIARDPMFFKVIMAQTLVQIVLFDIIWNQLDTSFKGIQSRVGFLFNCCLSQLFQCVQALANTCNIYTVPIEKNLYFKEEASNLYTLTPYYLSKQISMVPIHIIMPLIMAVSVYWVADLYNTAETFFTFCNIHTDLILVVSSFTGASYGFLGGILFSTPKEADMGTPILIVPWMLFAGMYSTSGSLPFSFGWIQYISPHYYAFHTVMANEFGDRELDCNSCDGQPTCTPCDPLNTYDIEHDDLWMNIGIFVVLGACLRTLAWALLYYKTYRGKKR